MSENGNQRHLCISQPCPTCGQIDDPTNQDYVGISAESLGYGDVIVNVGMITGKNVRQNGARIVFTIFDTPTGLSFEWAADAEQRVIVSNK